MEPASSISSSEPAAARAGGSRAAWWLVALVAIAAAWAAFAAAGDAASGAAASAWGERLVRAAKGRIVDPREFFYGRMRESLLLASALAAAGWLFDVTRRVLSRRVSPRWRWLPLSLAGFATVNGLFLAASGTAIFWMGLYLCHPNLKQAAFEFERIQLADSDAPRRVVVIGSSQGQSQIDTGLLNRRFAPDTYFANLSYAGSAAIDFLMIEGHFPEDPPDAVICYVSELNLYSDLSASRCPALMRLRDAPAIADIDPALTRQNGFYYGLVGGVLPVFRARNAVELAAFGRAVEGGPAAAFRTRPGGRRQSAAAPSRERPDGEPRTPDFQLGPDSEVQKACLERFLGDQRKRGTPVVVIVGQINPVVEARLDPDLLSDFSKCMTSLRTRFPDVVFLQNELPPSLAEDYQDAFHVTRSHRAFFTDRLGEVLESRLRPPRR